MQFGSVVGEEYSGGTSGPPTECRGLNPGKNPLAVFNLKKLPETAKNRVGGVCQAWSEETELS